MSATPGRADDAPFRWEGTMAEFDAEVRRRWIESSQQLGLDHGLPIPQSHYCDSGNCDVCGDGTGDEPKAAPVGPGRAAWLKSVELWGPGHAATFDDLPDLERGQWASIVQAGMDGSEYVRELERRAAQEPHAAPELAEQLRLVRLELLQAQGEAAETAAELSRIKARHAAVLGKFTSNGSGYTARMSGTVLARCYADANLPVRDDLSHLAGQ